MDEAATVREAATRAVGAVEPAPLRDRLETALAGASVVPGLLVRTCANALDAGVDPGALNDRVAGVQLVYAGLAVTRRLAGDPPWTRGGGEEANLDVLVADILVARGAYLLAGTEASDAAVGVIRAFGRDQTSREGLEGPDTNLEADVFELAAIAGATAVAATTPPQLRQWAGDLAAVEGGTLPEPAALRTAEPPIGPISVAEERPPDDGRVPSSGDR